jgi:hypothetical protein
MNSTKVKQENFNIEEVVFNDLFSKKDIANMSNESVDSIFHSVYKYIMKEDSAVYPHLDGI